MTLPIIPDGFCAAFELNLADRPEAVVGDIARVLGKIDANMTLIFVKFDKFEFAENFKYRHVRVPAGIYVVPDMVTAKVTIGLPERWPVRGNRNFTMTGKWTCGSVEKSHPAASKGPVAAGP